MSFNHSYQPDYYSLIDIAATEEKVLCKIEQTIPKLGFLDTSSETDDLRVGSKVELPFWMAKGLIPRRAGAPRVASYEVPKIYKENYREILEADSSVVLLSKWNQHFYEFGLHFITLLNDEEVRDKIVFSLLQTFKNRFQSIMDHAFNPISDSTAAFQLPAMERELYALGKKCNIELVNWTEKGTKKIETADVINVINTKKRKRAEVQLTS